MIELAIVVVLVGILSTMAITGWNRLMWHVRALGAAQEFRDAVLLARSDAVTKKRHSGIVIEPAQMRYLRFLDDKVNNGRYDASETLLQEWQAFPTSLIVDSIGSTMSPDPQPVACDGSPSSTNSSSQAVTYSLVFQPDGRSWADLRVKLGVRSFPDDTFFVDVLPATGLVQLRRSK